MADYARCAHELDQAVRDARRRYTDAARDIENAERALKEAATRYATETAVFRQRLPRIFTELSGTRARLETEMDGADEEQASAWEQLVFLSRLYSDKDGEHAEDTRTMKEIFSNWDLVTVKALVTAYD